MMRLRMLILCAGFLLSGSSRAEDPLHHEWQLPSEKLKLSFADDTPIIFVSRNQSAAEWDRLKNYWNESVEGGLDPKTGLAVERKVVKIKVPLGLNPPTAPPENPPTVAKWILGKKLYYDPILSTNGAVSCASCHDPRKGFTDQSKFSTGIDSQLGGMNAPTVINSAYNFLQFWDGRAMSLEDQAQGPVQNPVEMCDVGNTAWRRAIERVRKNKDYISMFAKAFGTLPNRDAIAKAIATYERTVISGNSIVDRADLAMRVRVEDDGGKAEANAKDFAKVLRESFDRKNWGELKLLGIGESDAGKIADTAAALARGRTLFFGKARCNSCHVAENFTDNQFHNLGVGAQKGKLPDDAFGRFTRLTTGHKNPELIGAFKTPTLRSLATTAPYLHDGSEETLEKVVDFYDRGGNINEFLDPKMRDFDAEKRFEQARAAGKKYDGPPVMLFGADEKPVVPLKLNLTPQEKKDLVLYLLALQGDPIDTMVADPKLAPPFPGGK
jgi:cytochrome c peroxidase